MPQSIVISLLYMVAFTAYFSLAIYVFFHDVKTTVRILFIVLCIALCLWALGFAISISALEYRSAFFWRRIGAIGWGSTHAVLLHYLLCLTEKAEVLKKRWLILLIYIPAVLIILTFGPISPLGEPSFFLVSSEFGWMSVTKSSLAGLLLSLNYWGYTLMELGLLIHWGHRTSDQNKRKQAQLLAISFFLALTIGPIKHAIETKIFSQSFQQIGLLLFLIPVSAIFYAIKKFDLMRPSFPAPALTEKRILTKSNRAAIYKVASLSLMLGGILYFILRHFLFCERAESSLLYAGFLLLYAIVLYALIYLPIKTELQDTIFIVMVGGIIPLLTLRLAQESASITIWAVSFVLILLSIPFQKRSLLLIISIIALTTQIIVWIRVPTAVVNVETTDFMGRIAILTLAIWLAFYINKLYVTRLAENVAQARTQQLISQISTNFMTVTTENYDRKLCEMLHKLGEFFAVHRVQLCLFTEASEAETYEWCSEQAETTKLCPLLSVPIISKGKKLGFLAFDALGQPKEWTASDQDCLGIIANLLSDALTKVSAEKEINHMAYYDKLTGLPNHSLFKKRLEKELAASFQNNKLVGVVFLNLDYFKTINDTMGHQCGDRILQQVAENMQERLRPYDTVCRFGGDEFLIMLPQMERVEEIYTAVEHLMHLFQAPMLINEQEFFVSASGGVSLSHVDGPDSDTLIKNADLALHAAKEAGKKQFFFCTDVLKQEVESNTQLTNYLYRAQERQELLLYYQPQINLATKKIVGAEALIRWKHPEKGLIFPNVFIPLAEQTGLINPIGQWALETACAQAKAWQDQGLPPLCMAVNLSVEQFRNPNLKDMIAHTLERTGLDPRYLELEITENIAIKEPDHIISLLNDLKAIGVSIAIDDFGTEYSSLSRLRNLPIDRIKIAMQFIHGISHCNKDEAIAKVIIHLAKNLGLHVIAEGVETETQLTFLTERACDEVQGYYFYKPMPATELEELLRRELKSKR